MSCFHILYVYVSESSFSAIDGPHGLCCYFCMQARLGSRLELDVHLFSFDVPSLVRQSCRRLDHYNDNCARDPKKGPRGSPCLCPAPPYHLSR